MRTRWDCQITKSHRSLSRTENSLQKLEQRRINERIKSIPSRTNEPITTQAKYPHKINFLGKVRTEIKELSDRTRTKSGKKLIGIFKKAHQTNINESFLKKIPKERTQKLNNEVRSVLKGGRSEGIPTIMTVNESPSPQSKTSTENINRVLKYQPSNFRSPNDARFRTVSYLNRAMTPEGIKVLQQEKEANVESKPKEEEKLEGEVVPIAQKINSQPSGVVPQEVGSIIGTARVSQEKQKESGSKIPTVKKDFRQYSNRSASHSQQTQHKERVAIAQAPKEEESNPKPENTVTKKNEPEQFNLDQLQTIEPIQIESPTKKTAEKENNSPSKKREPRQSNPKKDYYTSIYNDINDIDIEEITLISANQPKKESDTQPQVEVKVEKDWKTTLQNAKQSNNPYLPIDLHSKDKQKSEEKMVKLGSSLQSKVQEQVKAQDHKNIAKPEDTKEQPKKEVTTADKLADNSPKKQESVPEQSPKPDTKNPQKDQIIHILNKISKIHSQLQMLGQLATYFSKHSKTYKLSDDNKMFLRNEPLSWHFMVYLFFKYFYYMLLLFIKYYHFSSQTVMIKKEQLNEFSEENEKWAQTLSKIEKSVKKNAKANTYDDSYFKYPEAVSDLSQDNVEGLIKLYFLQQGSEQSFQFSKYMKSLRSTIFKQVTSFIKSMNLSNILSTQSNISLIFQQSAYRVFNSTIIIYQFHNPNVPQVKSCQRVQELDHPLLADFKNYYEKLTKQILIKK